MRRTRDSIPHVAVMIPLALKGHLDVFEGILDYVRLHGPWQLYRLEGRPGEQKLLDLKRWGCTGIIAGDCGPNEATLLARSRLPVVVFEPPPGMRGQPHPLANRSALIVDSHAIGVMAARYFLDRRYTRFAFVGDPHDLYWSRERERGFRETLAAAGATCTLYPAPSVAERRDWAIEQPRMQRWLISLAKPVALFAAMDGRARQVLDACLSADVSVPAEMAVLGVDDDPFICQATFPALSSIQTNGKQAGSLLAGYLDELMRGRKLRRRVFKVLPTRVIDRRSTEATAIPDRQVAQVLEFIWREAGQRPLSVPDVVRRFGSSRRFAEIHFKAVVGRTIMDEIRRVKLERVCALLAETNLSIGEITRRCGFQRESHLAFLFRKRFDKSMSGYRKAMRNGPHPKSQPLQTARTCS
jgi:LacI family transcriptional regulator